MKITATIQARMGSTRLPGKVLKTIDSKPLLAYQLERVARSRLIDEVIVATSDNKKDDAIEALCESMKIKCFRGSEHDVLGRIAALIRHYNVDLHVELIGDSPLNDPQIIDEVIGFYLKNIGKYDYVSNAIDITYPAGMETNVYSGRSLLEADARVPLHDPLREHVDIHLYKSDLYRCYNLAAPPWFAFPDIFLEVDTAKDFSVVSSVIKHFSAIGKMHFSLHEILSFLQDNDHLIKLNQLEERKYMIFKENKSTENV